MKLKMLRNAVLGSIFALSTLAMAETVYAQSFKNIQIPETPLILKAQGGFFVGGERVPFTHVELGKFVADGHVTVNQMYVQYMIPEKSQGQYPVVMVHGMSLTGNSWETTPDGRMGWNEYFVRHGIATFVVDQVGRGRSGFNESSFNNVHEGLASPKSQTLIKRFTDENVWPNFRFGIKIGSPYADTQYPVEAAAEASKQIVPDLIWGLPNPNPNFKALADLARDLDGAVLMSHSQSGAYPIEAALIDPAGIRALIMIEPGGIPRDYTDEQIKKLSSLPVLFVFGDHIGEVPEETVGHTWQEALNSAEFFVSRINKAGGNATMLHLPKNGIHGNSHMIMQDKNNTEIADMIIKWMKDNIAKK